MKTYKGKQLENLRQSGRILRGAFAALEKALRPGISTMELDKIAEEYILAQGGEPCFKRYENYGYSICASVNEESIHGMPRADKILADGDIISLDCGVRYPKGNGMCTDAARTFAIGEISDKARGLIEACEQCFHVATKDLRAGDRVGTIGEKIEAFIAGRYGIIDIFFGHGIGENVHQEPLIPNFNVNRVKDKKRREKLIERGNVILPEGVILCIEPMINCGTKEVKTGKDGWTVVTADGELAAHYENTLIVWKDKVEIVT